MCSRRPQTLRSRSACARRCQRRERRSGLVRFQARSRHPTVGLRVYWNFAEQRHRHEAMQQMSQGDRELWLLMNPCLPFAKCPRAVGDNMDHAIVRARLIDAAYYAWEQRR